MKTAFSQPKNCGYRIYNSPGDCICRKCIQSDCKCEEYFRLETTVKNVLFDLQATVEGSTTVASYSAFLPTSGSSSVYTDAIAPGETYQMSIEDGSQVGSCAEAIRTDGKHEV